MNKKRKKMTIELSNDGFIIQSFSVQDSLTICNLFWKSSVKPYDEVLLLSKSYNNNTRNNKDYEPRCLLYIIVSILSIIL